MRRTGALRGGDFIVMAGLVSAIHVFFAAA
jgi:hypothetical protein